MHTSDYTLYIFFLYFYANVIHQKLALHFFFCNDFKVAILIVAFITFQKMKLLVRNISNILGFLTQWNKVSKNIFTYKGFNTLPYLVYISHIPLSLYFDCIIQLNQLVQHVNSCNNSCLCFSLLSFIFTQIASKCMLPQ